MSVTATPAVGPRLRSNRAGRLLLALALFALTIAAALAIAETARAARPLLTGVTNIETSQPLGFQRVQAAGAAMVRIPLYWAATAPSPPADPSNPADPAYSWAESDEAVANAVAAGLVPMLQIDGAPSWAEGCNRSAAFPSAVCAPDPGALRAFGAAVVRRYSGTVPGIPAVRYFQPLNEPNLSLFFLPQFDVQGHLVSPFLYRDLVNAFYFGAKEARPGALVVAAGLGPNEVAKYTIGPMKFARKMLCMTGGARKPRPTKGDCGGGVHFDIFAIQPYTTGGPTHEGRANDVQLGDLPKLQRLIRAADRAGRIKGAYRRTPLWITEFSWDSRPPDPGGVPMKVLTRWVSEALHKAWSANVKRFFWFSLRDETRTDSRPYSETLESGLYFRGASLAADRPKPIERAFRFPLVAYPRNGRLQFWGRTPTSGPGQVRIQVKRQGKWRTTKKVRAGKTGVFRGRVRSDYGKNKEGAARAVFRGVASAPFSMRPVRDYYQRPFG